MRVEEVFADGEDGRVYRVHRIWAHTTTNPLVGARRTLDAGYEYKLASGEDVETVNDKAGTYRTWNGGVLITLRPD